MTELESDPLDNSGLVEIYGRQEAAECWVFGGWLSHRLIQAESPTITAVFERGNVSADALVGFYERDDLGGRGAGFLILLQNPQRRQGRLLRLDIQLATAMAEIMPAVDARELQGRPLVERGEAIAAACKQGTNLPQMRSLVSQRFIGEGYVDAYGYHGPSIGWFICGWVSNEWVAHAKEQREVLAHFETGITTGPVVLNFYDREDLRGKGLGFILHLATTGCDFGRLLMVTLRAGTAVVVTRPSVTMDMVNSDATAASFQALVAISDPGIARDQLRDLASRIEHDGRDTVASLTEKVFIEFDEVIECPPDSVVLIGWMLARPGLIRTIRLCSKTQAFAVDIELHFFWTNRADVLESLGQEHGFDDPKCGFIARVPTPSRTTGLLHLEIKTASGEIAYKTVSQGRLRGVSAFKRLLGEIDAQYTDVDALYDHILGPSIAALNRRRLEDRPRVSTLQLGIPVLAPRHSIIIPLYGRIDFMEIQVALFASLGLNVDVEIIYVLDDPPKIRETQFLATSLYARFKLPFKLLCLSRNMGFAPANNVGLAASTGRFVSFLNSDVLPTTGDWPDRLASHLEADPGLGVVGPILLFEDDSVQHQGIFFKGLPQFANWAFAHHTRKGFRRPEQRDIARLSAITGAAMMLRREVAIDCGGFDEDYIIGDFEDTDLCFRLAEKGLGAAVDFNVSMYHLERKSQASSANAWRTNLTLYNAWVHQRRWGNTILRLQDTL